MELDLDPNSVRRRLAEFYATLDLTCEIAESMTAEGVTPFLKQVFAGDDAFWRAVQSFQNLKGTYRTEEELIEKVSELLRENPRNFLILTHLHRQLRFTNLELVHFLFDRHQINSLEFYRKLLENDPIFQKQFERTASSKKWNAYVGSVNLQNSEDPALLASLKKVVTNYLGSEGSCWPLWKARIENDVSVSRRIAEFVVRNEDLKRLIENDSVKNALERSLRTVNVEIVKRERGEYGSRKVKEILEAAGFVFEQYSNIKDIEDLEKFLKSQRMLITASAEYIYTTEKLWEKEDKRFDFILISKNRVQFVMETNYFTTSMSKIREVVRHFMELKKACRNKYRLIYITDGMGWFDLAKNVKDMLEFEAEERKIDPSRIPFLVNLELFRKSIDMIKAEMASATGTR